MSRKKTILFFIFIMHVFVLSFARSTEKYLEKQIVVVIPSYNNSKYYERNVQSVLSQNYSNFCVLYTDDCSPDGTADLVENFLKDNDPEHKVTLIKNNIRRGALYNLYTMIYMCDDDAIIVTLDGDDWLPDDDVLVRLNDVYSSADVWLTYGQFQLYPSNIIGWATPMPDYVVENNAFRDFQHLPTHLRTFYAWLFKKIKTEDLLYLGKFYPMTWDQVMMFPMIEMAGERHKFISDIMYIYNDENSISDHYVSRQLQAYLAQVIRGKNRYQRLATRPTIEKLKKELCADVIIFADTPEKLVQQLDSLFCYVKEIGSIFVMYKPSNQQACHDYKNIEFSYPIVQFCQISEHRSNFKDELFALYDNSQNNYILFLKGDVRFNKELSLSQCIHWLNELPAYAFYFKLGAQEGINYYKDLPFVECRRAFFAWHFALASDKWSCANSLDCVLHQKSDFLASVLQGYYDLTPNGLEMVWGNEGNLDRLGLCFNERCVDIIK